jgi:hypothetical protein
MQRVRTYNISLKRIVRSQGKYSANFPWSLLITAQILLLLTFYVASCLRLDLTAFRLKQT